MKRIVLVLAGLLMIPALAFAEQKSSVITPLASTTKTATGQDIEVVSTPEIRTTEYELAPGAKLPVHKHPYQRMAYIISGSIDLVDVESDKTTTYKEGDFLVEMRDHWHYGANTSKESVKLIVFDIMPKGSGLNMIMQDGSVPKKSPLSKTELYATAMLGEPIALTPRPEIRTLIYEADPGTNFPVHLHPHPRILYILSGQMDIIDNDSDKIYPVTAGHAFVESVNIWHYGKNSGDVPVKMLVIDMVPPESGNNIVLKAATP